jgi:tight adherence protein B
VNRRLPLAVALAAALVAAVALPPAAAQQELELRIEEVDARDFPQIAITITPPPELYGVLPTGDEVTVLEDGVARPAAARLLTEEPLEVLLAVDTSGSMRDEPLQAAKAAAAGFVERMPPTTRIAVMGFASEPLVVADFDEDPAVALAALDTLEATGQTAIYDAVLAALDAFDTSQPARRFVVLLSDGGDTASAATLEEAAQGLDESGFGFYAVELQTDESDPEALETLAEVSAGRVVPAEDTAALAAVFDQVASELVNQLLLTYVTVDGGPVDLSISIEVDGTTARVEAPVALPMLAPPSTTTQATTTTTAPTTTTTTRPEVVVPTETLPAVPVASPPVAQVAEGPGLFGAHWVLPVGIAAFFVAALLVFGLALVPGGVPSQIRAVSVPFRPQGGWLSRLARSAQSAADSVLQTGNRRSTLNAALESAGINLAPGEFVVLSASAAIVGVAIGLALFGWVGALLFGAFALIAPRVVVAQRREKRRLQFADQLEGTLQLIAGSLRAGYGLMQAVSTVANEAPSPSNEEFGRIIVETRLGRDLADALHALADRMENQDFRWVAQAIDIQRSVGGDLSSILDTVGETIRERNQIRRQIRALSAEGRISSYVLIALPFVITFFLLAVAPDFLTPLVDTLAGRIAIGVASVLMVIGIIWIRRLVRLVF